MIEASELTKRYGRTTAVRDLTYLTAGHASLEDAFMKLTAASTDYIAGGNR